MKVGIPPSTCKAQECLYQCPTRPHSLSIPFLRVSLLALNSSRTGARDVRKRGKANCGNTHRDNSSLMELLAIYPYQVPATSLGICYNCGFFFSLPPLPPPPSRSSACISQRFLSPSLFVFPGHCQDCVHVPANLHSLGVCQCRKSHPFVPRFSYVSIFRWNSSYSAIFTETLQW